MKTSFYQAKTFNQMSPKQRAAFEKSYESYVKQYSKIVMPAEKMFNKSEYFEEYKVQRREKLTQGKTTAAIPRQIAASQKYERTYAQDLAQWSALKESDSFKKMHGDKSFAAFRRIQQKDLDQTLWAEINQARIDLTANGDSIQEINSFISAYYFGSPL